MKNNLGFLVSVMLAACGTGDVAVQQADEAADRSDAIGQYKKIWSCDGATVDVDESERRFGQIVIRDMSALKLFSDSHVVFVSFGQTELVISGGTQGRVDWDASTGPKVRFDGYGKGVFKAEDFDYFMNTNELGHINQTRVGRIITMYRKGSDITVQYANIEPRGCAGTIIFSDACSGEGGGTCPHSFCDGEDYTAFVTKAEYAFHNCLAQ